MRDALTDPGFITLAACYLVLSGLLAWGMTRDWWAVWAIICCPLIAAAMATYLVSQAL